MWLTKAQDSTVELSLMQINDGGVLSRPPEIHPTLHMGGWGGPKGPATCHPYKFSHNPLLPPAPFLSLIVPIPPTPPKSHSTLTTSSHGNDHSPPQLTFPPLIMCHLTSMDPTSLPPTMCLHVIYPFHPTPARWIVNVGKLKWALSWKNNQLKLSFFPIQHSYFEHGFQTNKNPFSQKLKRFLSRMDPFTKSCLKFLRAIMV